MATSSKPKPTQPWERQPGETPQAYRAFRAWLEMEPANRDFRSAYRALYGHPTATNTPGYFTTWTAKHQWRARALEYDNDRARVAHEAARKVIAEDARKWAMRRKLIPERDYEQGEKIRERIDQILALPLVRQTLTNTDVSEDGRTTVNHYTIEPVNVRVADAAPLFKTVSERQRLAAEMFTEIVETHTPESRQQKVLTDARQAMADNRAVFPDIDEQTRAQWIAQCFAGVSVEDLLAPESGVTTSEAIQ